MAPIRQPGDANSFSMEHMGKKNPKKLNPRNVGVPDKDKQELFSYNFICFHVLNEGSDDEGLGG